MHSIKKALVTLAFGSVAAISQAGTVTVTFDSPIFNGSGSDTVHIKFPKLGNGNGSNSFSVAAGRFQGPASNLVGIDPGLFVDGVDDLFMYCYDLYENIHSGAVVNYNVNFGGALARTLDFLGAVNTVMSAGHSYDPYAWLHPVNGYQGAAIQIGIWESRYETNSDWDLASGSFRAWDLESATTNYWNAFRLSIPTSNSLEQRYTMVLEARGAQDMIAGDPPLNVPEPGSLALMGLALIGLVASRRKSAAA